MRSLHLALIIGIVIVAIMIATYEIVQNSAKTTMLNCNDPAQADLQHDAEGLATRQQVESIVWTYPITKKLLDDSTYCEVMSVSTLYAENGTSKVININLNNTENLVVQVRLQNNSVLSYELFNLTRSSTSSWSTSTNKT